MLETSQAYKEWLAIEDIHNFRVRMGYRTARSNIREDDTFGMSDIMSFEYNDACVTGSFEFGATYAKNIKFELQNYDYKYNNYSLNGADLSLKIGLIPPEYTDIATQWLDKGRYTITEAKKSGKRYEITAVDDMIKFNIPFMPSMCRNETAEDGSPMYVTFGKLVKDICKCCGVKWSGKDFKRSGQILDKKDANNYAYPGGSCRDVIGWIAQQALGYARINNKDELEIIEFQRAVTSETDMYGDYTGGTFTNIKNGKYSDGNNVDGGDFTTYAADEPDYLIPKKGGTYNQQFHAINAIFGEENIIPYPRKFTGAVVESQHGGTVEHERPVNSEYIDSVICIRGNPLLYRATVTNAVADDLYDTYISRRYIQYELSIPADPSREPGDVVVITDSEGNRYCSIILNYTFKIGSPDVISADFGLENSDISWGQSDDAYLNN